MNTGAVIVLYNNEREIATCIHALKQNGIQMILVVDNASTDAGASIAVTLGANVISLEKNKGFAAAANIGAQALHTANILFVNPDAQVARGAVKHVEAYFDLRPTAGVVGMALCDDNGSVEKDSFGKTVTPWSLITRHMFSAALPLKCVSVGWVSGGAMMVRHKAWEDLKGFDDRFFMYWEDVDLCRRAHKKGWDVIFCPQAKAIHKRGASFSSQKQKTELFDQSADRYFQKHYPVYIWILQQHLRRLYRLLRPLAR